MKITFSTTHLSHLTSAHSVPLIFTTPGCVHPVSPSADNLKPFHSTRMCQPFFYP